MLQSIRLPCTIKPVKTRNVKTRIKCSSGSDYSDQTFDDVDTVLIKYFTFRSTQYTLGQVYEMDMSPMKSEFNWLCDFSNEHNPSSGDAFIEALYENGKTKEFQVECAINSFHRNSLVGKKEKLQYGTYNITITDPYNFCGDKNRYATEILFWGRRGGKTFYQACQEIPIVST